MPPPPSDRTINYHRDYLRFAVSPVSRLIYGSIYLGVSIRGTKKKKEKEKRFSLLRFSIRV